MRKILLPLIVLPLILVGCKDERQNPTKETFQKALQEAITAKGGLPACVQFSSPVTRRVSTALAEPSGSILDARYQTLKKLGYLEIQEKDPDETHSDKYLVLKVTPKYLKYLGEPQASMSMFGIDTPAKITKCYGHYTLDKVTDFTKPGDDAGQTTSTVEFLLTPVWDADAEWLKNKDLQDILFVRPNTEDIAQKTKMVYKDSGWALAE